MTNEEVYEIITSVLKEQGIGMNQLELKVKSETGKYPNLRITKSRLSLPNTVASLILLCSLMMMKCTSLHLKR